ncbi:probable ATP-dependent RNA helicase DDX43 [Glossina fuscipes]|uniref:RNA helicase n=1 Tax=Glossina fuscipes TaxID=7396 RepID=A0A8U0W382_9MUSC|nr:probable ATP-dependent RNA helicase DDX43 [Glossina fuscipes]
MSDWEDDEEYDDKPQVSNVKSFPKRSYGDNRRSDDSRRRDRDSCINRNSGRGSTYGRSFQGKESLYVRPESIGRIVGRAGSTIQRLQLDFNVRIDADKSRGKVTVLGDDKGKINDALNRIRQIVDEGHDGNNQSQRPHGSGYNRSDRNNQGYRSYGRDDDNPFDYHYLKTSYDRNENYSANQGGIIDWKAENKKAELARAERWSKRPPLTKDFYVEHTEVANMDKDDVDQIRLQNNNTTVSRVFEQKNDEPDNIPNPIWKFEQCFGQYPDLLAEVAKQQFKKPSPIQAQAWPILLKGEDLIGIAQTGTGKTLAFLLPALVHIEYQSIPRSERGGPNVLILAPTRELALQIEKETNKYSFRGIKAVCIYGGGNRRDQIQHVEQGVEVIICTPGRLNDLIQAKVIDVTTVTYLVLDEADRMLDMGFEPQIRKILLDIRPDRQTIMTSATWPPGVRRLAQSYMSNPIQVCVGSLDLAATHSVRQVVEVVEEGEKYDMIKSFVKSMRSDDKIIVFCGKKVRADDLSSDLTLAGYLCQAIHGSRDQADREQAIADITSGEVKILIATDVASRGLDIDDVTHVINYDFPRNIEEYVHRIGRTGRAGRTGTSISYVTRSDWGLAAELIKILEEAGQDVPDNLRDMADRFNKMKGRRSDENMRGRRGGGGGNRSYGHRNY